MQNTKNMKKLLRSLYAAGAVLGGSMLSGCVTRTVYVNADGYPIYTPNAPTYTPTSTYNNNTSNTGEILSGILMGIGQAL